MNLYVLEYCGSYVGGTAVVIASDIEQLREILVNASEIDNFVKENYPPMLDEKNSAWLNILNSIPFSLQGIQKEILLNHLKVSLDKFAPSDEKEKWAQILSSRLGDDKNHGYSDGYVRTDWALRHFFDQLKEGLYLTNTIKLGDDEVPRIVSHTSYNDG